MDTWLAAAAIFGSAIALAIVYLIIYFKLAPKAAAGSGITDADKLAAFKDSYTKTLAQIIGGVAVVATFSWTFIKDSRTLEQTATQNANQQFIDAVKLLSQSNSDYSNAAGIFSFKKLVETNPEYYTLVHHTLMTYIFGHQSDGGYPKDGKPPRVSDAVRAATYVLGQLSAQDGSLSFVDYFISGSDFSNAKSLQSADFRNTKLFAANFSSADLTGANFNGAAMADWESYGLADGWDKRLAQARSGHEEQLTQLLWKDERFRYIINFDSAILTGTHFENTSVDGASFKSATLNNATFTKTDISRADFDGAKGLETANFDQACYGSELERPLNLPPSILAKLLHHCP
jgi:hypothetical protein